VNLFYHLVDSNTANSPVAFDIFASVSNGSTIDFGADASNDGGFSDSTLMSATITTVPEPSLVGAVLGIALLVGRRSASKQPFSSFT
jgi:hypothetical protein